jgi:hypothetical protein
MTLLCHNRWVRRAANTILVGAGVACAATIPACEKPLFADKAERSQYDRYDAVRGQSAAPYVEDEFGRRYPNLRGRLMTRQ